MGCNEKKDSGECKQKRICVIEHQILNKVSYKQRPLNLHCLVHVTSFFLSILYVVGVLEKYVKRMLDQTDKSVLEFEDCLS
jgi:hypothetical protein